MPHRNSLRGPLAAVLVAVSLGVISVAWSAPADDLKEAQRLYQQGKMQPALDKVEVYLKSNPRDPQGRFLKGLVLTEQKRIPEAIQVFTGLTEDFPELPEPYNNLAVLYASQGNYDKAKAALELAIHTHPSYATAHENLGDIYAQLASRAYDRALQLDKTNTTAQVKLAMIKEIFSSQKVAAAASAPKTAAATPPAATPAPAPAPAPAPVKTEPAKAPPPVAEAKPAPAPAATPAPAPAATSAAAPGAAERKAQIVSSVESWARDWSSKDVNAYLSHYAVDFETPNGLTRAAWEKERGERIEKPKSIEVTVKILDVKSTENEATVTFKQSYKSDTLKNTTTKTLKLQRAGDRWLIKQERVGG